MTLTRFIPPRDLLIIILMAAFLLFPTLYFGATGIDVFTAPLWARHFSEQFWQGVLYPRWLPNMFVGHGSPTFFFYPPLPFFVTALFYPLTPLDTFNFYPIVGSAFVGLVLAGIFCHAWLRSENISPTHALLASLFYMSMPTYIAQSFYALMLIGQTWAFTWFPLLMWMSNRVSAREKNAWIGFAIALALMFFTNIPNTVFFVPAVGLYTLIQTNASARIRVLKELIFAALVGLGLSSIYLLPAFMYQSATLIPSQWKQDEFSYLYRLFYVTWENIRSPNGILYSSVIAASVIMVSALAIRFYQLDHKKNYRSRISCWSAISACAIFLNFSTSAWLWKYVPFLSLVQMPARLFALPTIAIIWMSAHWLEREKKIARPILIAMIGIFFGLLLWMASERYVPHKEIMANPESPAAQHYINLFYKRFVLSVDQNYSYLPAEDVVGQYFEFQKLDQLQAHNPVIESFGGEVGAEVIMWRARHIEMNVLAPKGSKLAIRQFYFPGWKAEIEGREIPIERELGTGRILLYIPASPNLQPLTLTLETLWPERIGQLISMFTLIGIIGCASRKTLSLGEGRVRDGASNKQSS